MLETRSVFGILVEGNAVLLSKRAGKDWKLPGGRVRQGESDAAAVRRIVSEETGLEVEVSHVFGPEKVFEENTAVAYACGVVGGTLISTEESVQYVTAEDVKRGWFSIAHRRNESGMSVLSGFEKIQMKIVGPKDRLGWMGRMVLDAFSIMDTASTVSIKDDFDWSPFQRGLFMKGSRIFSYEGSQLFFWPRLDPTSSTGVMMKSE